MNVVGTWARKRREPWGFRVFRLLFALPSDLTPANGRSRSSESSIIIKEGEASKNEGVLNLYSYRARVKRGSHHWFCASVAIFGAWISKLFHSSHSFLVQTFLHQKANANAKKLCIQCIQTSTHTRPARQIECSSECCTFREDKTALCRFLFFFPLFLRFFALQLRQAPSPSNQKVFIHFKFEWKSML